MMLADTTPDSVTSWLSPLGELGKTGLLGILLVLAIWAIIKLYRDLGIAKDGRLTDAKSFTDLVKANTEATTKWASTQDERNRAMTDMANAIARMADRK